MLSFFFYSSQHDLNQLFVRFTNLQKLGESNSVKFVFVSIKHILINANLTLARLYYEQMQYKSTHTRPCN